MTIKAKDGIDLVLATANSSNRTQQAGRHLSRVPSRGWLAQLSDNNGFFAEESENPCRTQKPFRLESRLSLR